MAYKCLVKVSGDLVDNKEAILFVESLSEVNDYDIVVIVGGSTQVSKALKDADFDVAFEDGRRVHENAESKKLATKVLKGTLDKFRDNLNEHFLGALTSPIVNIEEARSGSNHVNADEYLRILAPNYEHVYCLTKKGRKKYFPSRIEVKEFE